MYAEHEISNEFRTFVTDTQSKRPLNFYAAHDAIEFCREHGKEIENKYRVSNKKIGLGYEISYPHVRYHTRKNYGDNFKWKGNPTPAEEDI